MRDFSDEGFEQMAKAQDGAFTGLVFLAHVRSGKRTKRRRVVQRIFHRRVGQVEPLLQEVDAQLVCTGDGGPLPLVPRVDACGAISATSSDQGTTRFISSRNSRLHVRFVLRSNPLSLRLMCFIASTLHVPCQRGGSAEFPKISLKPPLDLMLYVTASADQRPVTVHGHCNPPHQGVCLSAPVWPSGSLQHPI